MEEQEFISEPFPSALLTSDGEAEVISSSSEAAGERFQGELGFIGHLLPRLGAALQMKSIRFGLIEDDGDQLSFAFGKNGIECVANPLRTQISAAIPKDILTRSTTGDGSGS